MSVGYVLYHYIYYIHTCTICDLLLVVTGSCLINTLRSSTLKATK